MSSDNYKGNYFLTGGDIPEENPVQRKARQGVSEYILGQLKSRNETVVVIGIRNMVRELSYPAEDVCEILAGILRRGASGKVSEEAASGLLATLGRVPPTSATRILNSNLFCVNDRNGEVLSMIIAEPALAPELRQAAINLLKMYREGDIGRETFEKIEVLILKAVLNDKDDIRFRKTIEMAFARGPGLRISTIPPKPPWEVKSEKKTFEQLPRTELIANTRKPVKA